MTAQQLKNSILQMAVQGKLVPQDPSEEPASVLLERIRAEKEKLIKAGKIKREKNPSVIFRGSDNLPYEKIGKETRCIADEVPFEIPDSWVWVRLDSIILTEMGQSPAGESVSTSPSGVEFHQGKVFFGRKFLLPSNQTTTAPSKIVDPSTILLCVRAPVGKVNITQRRICIGRGLCGLNPIIGYDRDFLYSLLESYEDVFVKKATGTTFIAITADVVKKQLIPLPPLAEQKRIVAKIEELLPHLDEYDQAETRVKKLNAEFPEQLKKSILQWAIQGKLVPQNPDDEPASVLLDRIRTEKAKLVKSGKIKKDKTESVIFRRDNSHYTVQDGKEICLDDQLPFEIPLSWSWVKLKELLEQASTGPFGSMLHKSDYVESGVPLINPANIEGTQISDIGIKKVSINTAERLRSYKLFSGDVIIGRRGELGRSAVVPDRAAGWLCGTGCFFVTTNAALLPDYLVFLLASPYIREALMGKAVGTTMNNLNHGILGNLLIPLPPEQEQRRILMQWEILIKRFFA